MSNTWFHCEYISNITIEHYLCIIGVRTLTPKSCVAIWCSKENTAAMRENYIIPIFKRWRSISGFILPFIQSSAHFTLYRDYANVGVTRQDNTSIIVTHALECVHWKGINKGVIYVWCNLELLCSGLMGNSRYAFSFTMDY